MRLSRREAALGAGALAMLPGFARADARIPFRVTRNTPWTGVVINKKEPPLAFLIDTGAGNFGIRDEMAVKYGLSRMGKVKGQAAVGRFDLTVYRVNELVVGGAVRELDLLIGGLPGNLPEGLQGIVPTAKFGSMGFDFDAGEVLIQRRMDGDPDGYDSLRLIVTDNNQGSLSQLGAASNDPADRQFMDLRPTVEAEFDGEKITLVLDTGASASVHLFPDYVKKRGLWDHYPKQAPAYFTTLARGAEGRLVRAERLKLGKFVFAAPHVILANPEDSDEDGSARADGVIGMELLRRLNFINDPTKRRVWIKPSKAIGDGYRIDRAGVNVRVAGGGIRVVGIAPGGPAWRAGLRMGDRISGWRGADGYDGLVWALQGAPGSKVEIQVDRGGKAELIGVVLEERV